MYSIIETFLSTLILTIPPLNIIPYKINKTGKLLLFIITYFIMYVGYFVTSLSSLTNLIVIPAIFLLIAIATKRFFISFILVIFNYLFIVLLNNMIVGILLKMGINFLSTIYTTIIFEICFILLSILITFGLGKYIQKKILFLEDLNLLRITKKILTYIFLAIIFIIYQVLIFKWSIGYTQEVVINNTIMMSLFFIFILVIMLYLLKKIYNYEKKIDIITHKINNLNNYQIKNIEKIILDENVDDKRKKILKEILQINSKDNK